MSDPATPYPLRLEARLDDGLSRWRWLVKWLLILPHVLVLAVLWIGFVLATAAALVAIVATARYPRGLFDFNVGVLRWTWRVGFYSYGALGTDRYPPFTLADVPGYPARLHVQYPPHLSRGLALVKWWLLALPQYLVVGILTDGWHERAPGLIGTLVLVAGGFLLFTAGYPGPLFGLVVGLNRWTFRVIAYAALMTDAYPPFRLDAGAAEPSGGRAAPSLASP